MAGWPKKSRWSSRKNISLLLVKKATEEDRCRQYRIIRLVFFVSFYRHSRLVARLMKCEITFCIGNTHVLKLVFRPIILNYETYRPDLL